MESTDTTVEDLETSPEGGGTHPDPALAGESEPSAKETEVPGTPVAPGSAPTATVENLQRQLADRQQQLSEAQKLIGSHNQELDFYRKLEDRIADDEELFTRVQGLLSTQAPVAPVMQPQIPPQNGAGFPGLPAAAPSSMDANQRMAMSKAVIQKINDLANPEESARELDSLLQFAQEQAAELGAKRALEKVAPLFQEREVEKRQALESSWAKVRQDVQEKLGIDILDPTQKVELIRANRAMAARMGLPPNTSLPPDLITAYAYRDKYLDAGKRLAEKAEEERRRQAGAASHTVTPTTTPRGSAPKMSKFSDYIRHYEKLLTPS